MKFLSACVYGESERETGKSRTAKRKEKLHLHSWAHKVDFNNFLKPRRTNKKSVWGLEDESREGIIWELRQLPPGLRLRAFQLRFSSGLLPRTLVEKGRRCLHMLLPLFRVLFLLLLLFLRGIISSLVYYWFTDIPAVRRGKSGDEISPNARCDYSKSCHIDASTTPSTQINWWKLRRHVSRRSGRSAAQGEGRKKAKNYRFFRNISALAHAMNRKKARCLTPIWRSFHPILTLNTQIHKFVFQRKEKCFGKTFFRLSASLAASSFGHTLVALLRQSFPLFFIFNLNNCLITLWIIHNSYMPMTKKEKERKKQAETWAAIWWSESGRCWKVMWSRRYVINCTKLVFELNRGRLKEARRDFWVDTSCDESPSRSGERCAGPELKENNLCSIEQ